MSTNAATEEALGSIHAMVAGKLKDMLDDPEKEIQAVKLAIDFLNKNTITCVKNEIEATGELDKALQRRKRRFGSQNKDSVISDLAAERAKRVINE